MLNQSSLSLFGVQLLPGLNSTEGNSTDCTDILKIMREWNSLTQILDFRIVMNNKSLVVTGRSAAAAPLSKHSDDMSDSAYESNSRSAIGSVFVCVSMFAHNLHKAQH